MKTLETITLKLEDAIFQGLPLIRTSLCFANWCFRFWNWLRNWLFNFTSRSDNRSFWLWLRFSNSASAAELSSLERISIVDTTGIWISIIPLRASIVIRVSNRVIIDAVWVDNWLSFWGRWKWLLSWDTGAAEISSNEHISVVNATGIWVSIVPFSACVIIRVSNGVIIHAVWISNWLRSWCRLWNWLFRWVTGAAESFSTEGISVIQTTGIWVVIIPFCASIII
jgi:hypothetical protein